MASLLMTPEISRRYASACDKATVTDKKIEGVPQRCPNTVLLGLFTGFAAWFKLVFSAMNYLSLSLFWRNFM